MPDPTPSVLQSLRTWHRDMHTEEPSREARQLKSQLRRARTLDDARSLSGLYRILGDSRRRPYDCEVLTAMLLPHIKVDTDRSSENDFSKGKSFALLAANSAEGASRPRISESRFRRLLENETLDSLALPLVRALRLTSGEASISRLHKDLCNWENPHVRHHPRTDWAHDYYTTLLHA